VTIDTLLKALAAIIVPLATLVGVISRKRRLRSDIRENLGILEEIEKHSALRARTPVITWMHGRVALDVAKLTGQQLGTRKKPIPWGSVVITAIIASSAGAWTYFIVDDGFVWYSVFLDYLPF
jgi:hypothetical protein